MQNVIRIHDSVCSLIFLSFKPRITPDYTLHLKKLVYSDNILKRVDIVINDLKASVD